MDNGSYIDIIQKVGTPCFVYNTEVIEQNISRIFNSAQQYGLGDRIKIYVSYFANSHPYIFKRIVGKNIGILLQTKEELTQLKEYHLDTDVIISPSFLSNEEISFWRGNNIDVNLASLEEVEYWINEYRSPMSFRLDLSKSQDQRTGIKIAQLKKLKTILDDSKITPKSLHTYCGTGSNINKMKKYLNKTFKIYIKLFPDVLDINLGGGFGFDYEAENSEDKHFDWDAYFAYLKKLHKKYSVPNEVNFILEPGRDILADAGYLILQVKRVINFPKSKQISTDGSFVYLPSAKQRNRNHKVTFLKQDGSSFKNPTTFRGKISGATTLSTDYVLPDDVEIPKEIKAGDYLVIHDVGAYAATQHMEFLNKSPLPEVIIEGKNILQITNRGSEIDKLRNIIKIPTQL